MRHDDNALSIEKSARRGDEIYERALKVILEGSEHGRIVAIDILSGDYALDDTVLGASDRLQKESGADPQNIYLVRIGSKAVYQILTPERCLKEMPHE